MAEKKTDVKKTAEVRAAQEESDVKTQVQSTKIQVNGPTDADNGAEILRFVRDGRKKPIDITKGQILTVGDDGDLTQDEAQRLLNYSRWDVKEVNE